MRGRIAGAGFAAVLGVGISLLWPTEGADQSATQKSGGSNVIASSISPDKLHLPEVIRPAAEQPPVGLPFDTHLDKTPPRRTKGLDLVKMGWTYNCMECHKLFPARWHYDRSMVEHEEIRLQHGGNRFCLNCHHPTNRNAFVDYDGSEIAQRDVVLLCAKCHGPTYRDWKAGVHGRQNGFWKVSMGEKTRLRCIQCHDPHHPKFATAKPLPPLRYPSRAANSMSRTQDVASKHH